MTLAFPIPHPVRDLGDCLNQIARARNLRSVFMQPLTPLPEGNPLLPPLLDAVHLFTELQIPYALIGGIAAMVYGRARFTEDVDFVAAANHQSVLAAHPDIMQKYNFDPACTWKLYHHSGVEIDIWKDQHSDAIAARAKNLPLHQTTIKIADLHDLIAMKLRAARLQDDYDIGQILQSGHVDESLLQPLITPDEFARFKQIQSRAKQGK